MTRIARLLLAALSIAPTVAPAAQAPTPSFQPADPNDPVERIGRYLRVLSTSPRDLEALTGAGRAALDVGDANAAIGFFGRAQDVAPRDGRVKAGLAAALVQMEQPREALKLFDQAVALGVPVVSIAADRGLAYDLRGDSRRAQADYRIALQEMPNDETVRRLALSQAMGGDRAGALATLDPLLRRQDKAAWRASTFVLAITGDAGGAVQRLNLLVPAQQATQIAPFLGKLAALKPAEQARAVHFGHLPSDARATAGSATASATPPRATPAPTPPRSTALASAAPAMTAGPARTTGSTRAVSPPVVGQALVPAGAPLGRSAAPVVADARAARAGAALPAPGFSAAPDAIVAARPTVSAAPAVAMAANPPSPDPAAVPAVLAAAASPMAESVGTVAAGASAGPIASAPADGLAAISTYRQPVTSLPPAPVRMAGAAMPSDLAPRREEPVDDVPHAAVTAQIDRPRNARIAAHAVTAPAVAPAPADRAAPAEIAPPHRSRRAAASIDELAMSDETPAPRSKTIRSKDAADAGDKPLTPKEARALAAKEAKAKADEKLAAAKAAQAKKDKLAAAAKKKQDLADAKAAAAKAKAAPSRYWVQVATGANKADLPKAWGKLKTQYPQVMAGKSPWTTPLRFTNRLLVGPFKSADEAQGFVNGSAKAGFGTSSFTSSAGQAVERVGK